MKTSTNRILTTHVGSLIRPQALQDIMRAKQGGQQFDQAAYDKCLKELGRRSGAAAGGDRHRRTERRRIR